MLLRALTHDPSVQQLNENAIQWSNIYTSSWKVYEHEIIHRRIFVIKANRMR